MEGLCRRALKPNGVAAASGWPHGVSGATSERRYWERRTGVPNQHGIRKCCRRERYEGRCRRYFVLVIRKEVCPPSPHAR